MGVVSLPSGAFRSDSRLQFIDSFAMKLKKPCLAFVLHPSNRTEMELNQIFLIVITYREIFPLIRSKSGETAKFLKIKLQTKIIV